MWFNSCEHSKCHWVILLKMVKIVNYVSYVFYHNKKNAVFLPWHGKMADKARMLLQRYWFSLERPSSLLFPFGSSNLEVCHFRIKRLLSIQMSLFEVLSAYKRQTVFPVSKGTWTFYRHWKGNKAAIPMGRAEKASF